MINITLCEPPPPPPQFSAGDILLLTAVDFVRPVSAVVLPVTDECRIDALGVAELGDVVALELARCADEWTCETRK